MVKRKCNEVHNNSQRMRYEYNGQVYALQNRCELGQELAVQLRLKADFKEAGDRV